MDLQLAAARDPSKRWVNIASSPVRQCTPWRTDHCETSHIRVWLTSQPSVSSSVITASMQHICRSHESLLGSSRRYGNARSGEASPAPSRA